MAESSALDFAQLTDWVEGRLSAEAAQAMAIHVAESDAATHATVAWLRAFAQVSTHVTLVAPPRETHNALAQRFADFARQRKEPGLIQRILATLTFDSGLQPMAVGLRSAAIQPAQRQLLYSAEIADVTLNIHPRHQDQRLDLSGQVFAQGDLAIEGRVVHLMRGDTNLDIATTDELGEFVFEAVPPGSYALTLMIDQAHILITPVELRM
jgi:hypothetical protein